MIRRLAQATTMSESPVKSSAPPMMTRISPSEKASPANIRMTPHGRSPDPVSTTVMKLAPRAMNAPARMPRTTSVTASREALEAPAASQASAISEGMRVSICGCIIVSHGIGTETPEACREGDASSF